MGFRTLTIGTVLALTFGFGAGPSLGVHGVVQAQVEETGLGIRLLDAPVARRDDPRAGVSVIDHVSPGASISRRVELSNDTSQPLRARTYVGSADISDGQFLGDEDTGSGDLSRWASVEPDPVSMGPRERATARVTINVPSDAAPGERYGVVWAETPRPEGAGIGQVNRIGVRIYLSVGEGNEPASDFAVESLQASREGQLPVVKAQVRNTGGRAIDVRGELRLAEGPGGLSAGPFAADLATTLKPGDVAPVRFELDEALPDGPWVAQLTARSGLLERTTEATITFPDQGEAAPVDAELVDDSGPPWLWIALGAGLLLALALLLLFLLKRRNRRDEDDKKTDVVVAPPA